MFITEISRIASTNCFFFYRRSNHGQEQNNKIMFSMKLPPNWVHSIDVYPLDTYNLPTKYISDPQRNLRNCLETQKKLFFWRQRFQNKNMVGASDVNNTLTELRLRRMNCASFCKKKAVTIEVLLTFIKYFKIGMRDRAPYTFQGKYSYPGFVLQRWVKLIIRSKRSTHKSKRNV